MNSEDPPDYNDEASSSMKKVKQFTAREDDFVGANDEALAIRLAHYEEEHRDLDIAIRAMETSAPTKRLAIARMKKKKLQLKDKIQKLKNEMLPDIIA